VAQFINRACFTKDGVLVDEYEVLFSSLFDNSERHYQIVEVLDSKKSGLTRNEIIKQTNISSGGNLTTSLNELEESGFITTIIPYQHNKTKALYKLVDNFIIFYFKFMRNHTSNKKQNWTNITNSQSWVSWSGLAFERLCFSHISQIKKALKIEVIASDIAPWTKTTKPEGAQIDMVIGRADRIINVCEIKFANSDFTIDKSYAKNLRNKIQRFSEIPANKRKNIFLTMVTTFGVINNEYYKELVQNDVVLADLFLA